MQKKHGKNVVLQQLQYYNKKKDIIELWQKMNDI